jgi:hypothetical protein
MLTVGAMIRGAVWFGVLPAEPSALPAPPWWLGAVMVLAVVGLLMLAVQIGPRGFGRR